MDDHGFALPSYYYNPLANASREDLTVSLNDMQRDGIDLAPLPMSNESIAAWLANHKAATWTVKWVGINQVNGGDVTVKLISSNPDDKEIECNLLQFGHMSFKPGVVSRIISSIPEIKHGERMGVPIIQKLLGISGNTGLRAIVLEIQVTDLGSGINGRATDLNSYPPEIIAQALSNQHKP